MGQSPDHLWGKLLWGQLSAQDFFHGGVKIKSHTTGSKKGELLAESMKRLHVEGQAMQGDHAINGYAHTGDLARS
jgi:hypothetical protein